MSTVTESAIVCFSGGHSSAIAAIETVKRYGKNNVILLNHDISSHVEHKDIKRFKEDIQNYCDVPITYANAPNFENMPPLEVCKQKGAFNVGNQQSFCTFELKTKLFNAWLSEHFPASIDMPCKDVKIIYGFDANEPSRIQRRSQMLGIKGYLTDYPLAFWNRSLEKTEDIGIPRPSTYRIYKHANCTGCLKAGKQHWYCVYCLRQDIFEEAKKAEEQIGYSIIKGIYMSELESLFEEMKNKKGICPNDKEPQTFWAKVNNALPGQISFLPCDCSF